jgi:hypothetical protein
MAKKKATRKKAAPKKTTKRNAGLPGKPLRRTVRGHAVGLEPERMANHTLGPTRPPVRVGESKSARAGRYTGTAIRYGAKYGAKGARVGFGLAKAGLGLAGHYGARLARFAYGAAKNRLTYQPS